MFQEQHYLERPLRLGMVGGGKGSQIGYAHRSAAARDNLFQLVCGAFDLDHQRGRDFGQSISVDPQRCYADYKNLITQEKIQSDGLEVLIVATPNHTHYEITKAALSAKIHVICEKPLTFTSAEARELNQIAQSQGVLLCVMYGYSGYVMVEQARAMVEDGTIGEVRIINMQFAHGYHAEEVEAHDPGTKWRITPEIAGPSYVLGDIGTHCFQMGQLIGQLNIDSLLCVRQSFIKNRAPLEDNAHVILKYSNGAVGTLWASAVNIGSAHGFKVRVVGSKGSIEWWDERPNQLSVEMLGQPPQVYERGLNYIDQKANFGRIGGGHPEGFFESWANLYRRFGVHMAGVADKSDVVGMWYPAYHEGYEGVKFIEKCVLSADQGGAWVDFGD